MEERVLAEENFRKSECEINPNKRAATALMYAVFVLISTWLLNEFGIYRVEKMLMREGSVIALLFLIIPMILISSDKLRSDRNTKYITVICASAAILVVNILMTFHTMLSLILPMLLAMQYKSRKVGITAFVCSSLCTFAAPIVSFLIGTWDTLFLQVLLENAGFASEFVGVPFYSRLSSVGQIALYISLPEELIIIIVAFSMFKVIENGRKSLDDQIEIKRSNARIVEMQDGIINGMASIIESRDGGTGEHVANTRHYVSEILQYMLSHGIDQETVTQEYADYVIGASILHDIGKISIPDAILKKPGLFTSEEYEIMKTHTTVGENMIDKLFGDTVDSRLLTVLHAIVGSHHEKWDGSGYPLGLSGDQIPLEGRIMAIADVFDALISKRVYKEPYSIDEAYQILESEAGTHFDASLVEIFVSLRPAIESYARQHL